MTGVWSSHTHSHPQVFMYQHPPKHTRIFPNSTCICTNTHICVCAHTSAEPLVLKIRTVLLVSPGFGWVLFTWSGVECPQLSARTQFIGSLEHTPPRLWGCHLNLVMDIAKSPELLFGKERVDCKTMHKNLGMFVIHSCPGSSVNYVVLTYA